ncbi:MAG TPA: signal recognition particle-docking protein FtsY [Burkholderiales bacterium]
MFGLFKRKQDPSKITDAAVPQPDALPAADEATQLLDTVEPASSPAELAPVTVAPMESAHTETETATASTPVEAQSDRSSWFNRLTSGLKKTGSQLTGLFGGGRIDEALFEELETALLSADAGVDATGYLLQQLRNRVRKDRLETAQQLKEALIDELTRLLQPLESPPVDVTNKRPFVAMIAGVNGAGKTTSIGKLARLFQTQGLSVLLAAGDTFRAAAREQLAVWGERNNIMVVAQDGGDPAAVIFDAIHAARARGVDVMIADTAGRLPTQLHLMAELKKVRRVIGKADASAPHAVWLVLDANTGQNALAQVKAFDDAVGLTGLILTKLDGTAKGGVVAAIARTRPVPLLFIGIGEGVDDLRPFVAADFARALLA